MLLTTLLLFLIFMVGVFVIFINKHYLILFKNIKYLVFIGSVFFFSNNSLKPHAFSTIPLQSKNSWGVYLLLFLVPFSIFKFTKIPYYGLNYICTTFNTNTLILFFYYLIICLGLLLTAFIIYNFIKNTYVQVYKCIDKVYVILYNYIYIIYIKILHFSFNVFTLVLNRLGILITFCISFPIIINIISILYNIFYIYTPYIGDSVYSYIIWYISIVYTNMDFVNADVIISEFDINGPLMSNDTGGNGSDNGNDNGNVSENENGSDNGNGSENPSQGNTFSTSNDDTVECEHRSRNRVIIADCEDFSENPLDCTICGEHALNGTPLQVATVCENCGTTICESCNAYNSDSDKDSGIGED